MTDILLMRSDTFLFRMDIVRLRDHDRLYSGGAETP